MNRRKPRVLVIDDDHDVRWALSLLLNREGFEPIVASDGREGMELLSRESPELVLLDVRMPGLDGAEVLPRIKALDADLPVIIITGFGSIEDAVLRMRAGACDYITKPFEHARVVESIQRALSDLACRRSIVKAGERGWRVSLSELMGQSSEIAKLESEVIRVAQSDLVVIISGETGVGKEVVARAIHALSARRAQPFIGVDCSAVPDTLVESELFGYEKGAFTGADCARPGKFEAARDGTLLLDEIVNMPVAMQGKLLRALQERRFFRVGGVTPVSLKARILVCTNRDLSAIGGELFRSDLYYRLAEYTIDVPPLRERAQDIMYLATRFLALSNEELCKRVRGFAHGSVVLLESSEWPGNVRELRNAIRRAALLATDQIEPEHLAQVRAAPRVGSPERLATDTPTGPLKEAVRRSVIAIEIALLQRVMRETGGNKTQTARILRVDYKTLLSKLREHGISKTGDRQ